jgi:hypothetical protein
MLVEELYIDGLLRNAKRLFHQWYFPEGHWYDVTPEFGRKNTTKKLSPPSLSAPLNSKKREFWGADRGRFES